MLDSFSSTSHYLSPTPFLQDNLVLNHQGSQTLQGRSILLKIFECEYSKCHFHSKHCESHDHTESSRSFNSSTDGWLDMPSDGLISQCKIQLKYESIGAKQQVKKVPSTRQRNRSVVTLCKYSLEEEGYRPFRGINIALPSHQFSFM